MQQVSSEFAGAWGASGSDKVATKWGSYPVITPGSDPASSYHVSLREDFIGQMLLANGLLPFGVPPHSELPL